MKKALKVIGVIIILLVVMGAIVGEQETSDADNARADNVQSESVQPEAKEETISEQDAELFCQDANLLQKYVHLDKTSIIDMWSYNKQFMDDWGQYDSDGNPVVSIGWTGKDKTDDSPLRFTCWVAGTKDDMRLMQLDIGGVTVHAVPMYDKDGNEIE